MDQHTISSMMFCSSVKCLPRQLTAELKEWHVDAYQKLLKRFEAGDGLLGRIVKGDETWVYYQPETKKASKEWHHTSSPKPKKFRTQPSARKVMLTLFWGKRRIILEHYIPKGNTVTHTMYANLLKNHLHPAIKSKRRGRLSTGVLLHVRSHTACSTVATIQVWPLSISHIRRTRQTSPPVTFLSLDRSKRRWEASLSGPTKRSSRRCASGCALSQKNFLEVCPHFRSAGTLVWNTVETT
jgi:hypothetical protein